MNKKHLLPLLSLLLLLIALAALGMQAHANPPDNAQYSVGAYDGNAKQAPHPQPWAFYSDGRVEARGYWTGIYWHVSGNRYQMRIVHQGITDEFFVDFSNDWSSFTAYKGSAKYRWGVRTN